MNEQNNDNWFLAWLLRVCLVIWAAVMFSKTAEVFTALAPVTILGQTGLETLYGIVTASLIEGVAVVLALLPSTHTNRNATLYAGFLYLISTFCQFLDYSIVKDVATRSETEAFFSWIALGIPSLGFGGLLLLLWTVTSKPNVTQAKRSSNFVGVVPMFRNFIYGSGEKSHAPVQMQQDTPQIKKVKPSTNGKKAEQEEETNP